VLEGEILSVASEDHPFVRYDELSVADRYDATSSHGVALIGSDSVANPFHYSNAHTVGTTDVMAVSYAFLK
jgi:hypothetical protein